MEEGALQQHSVMMELDRYHAESSQLQKASKRADMENHLVKLFPPETSRPDENAPAQKENDPINSDLTNMGKNTCPTVHEMSTSCKIRKSADSGNMGCMRICRGKESVT